MLLKRLSAAARGLHPAPAHGMMPSPFRYSPLSLLTISITALLLTGYASKLRYHLANKPIRQQPQPPTKQSLQTSPGGRDPPYSSAASQNRALAIEIDRETRQKEHRRRLHESDREAEAAAAVEDAYGDRSSLKDLERAVEAYSKR